MNNRQSILEFLYSSRDSWISGEEISSSLGISRTAVWKNIKFLKEKGYIIESSSKLGYKFKAPGTGLDEYKIRNNLNTEVIGRKNLIVCEETVSTNIDAFKLASQGAEEGTVLVAENQTGGKGRFGRSWLSVQGRGLYLSIILRPQIAPSKASGITIAAAVALSDTLDEFGIKNHEIKWPNDILINGRKISGILTEMKGDADKIDFIITGIGINLNTRPEDYHSDVKKIAASVSDSRGGDIDRCAFLQSLLRNFERYYLNFINSGFSDILDIWKEKASIIGRQIKVSLIDETFTGVVKGLNAEGFLIVETETGERLINSGDINYI